MSGVLENELKALRQDLAVGFQETKPTEQFRTTMILGTIRMDLLASKINEAQDPEERRRLIREFEKGKEILGKGIQILKKQAEQFGKINSPPGN